MDIKSFFKKIGIPLLIVGVIIKFLIELFNNSGATKKLQERGKDTSDKNVKDIEREITVELAKQATDVTVLNQKIDTISDLNNAAIKRRDERENEAISTMPLPEEWEDHAPKSI